jgi:hypothetical protein
MVSDDLVAQLVRPLLTALARCRCIYTSAAIAARITVTFQNVTATATTTSATIA